MSETNEDIVLAKEASGAVPLRSATPTKLEVALQTIRGMLKTYETEMAVNREVTIEVGVSQQMSLLRAVKMVLRLDYTDFNAGWGVLLEWAGQHTNDLLNMNHRNRFLDYAKTMPARDRKLFQSLIHLLAITADPATRKLAMSRYDFGRIHKLLDKDEAAAKLEGFYQN